MGAEGAGLSIPPGAWPEGAGPASVTLVENPPPAPAGLVSAGSAVYFGPTGIRFSSPVTLALPFRPPPADTQAALAAGSMEYKIFKIVDGQFVEHVVDGQAPAPQIATTASGAQVITVPTLTFSAYQTLIVPAGVVGTTTPPPPPSTNTTPAPPSPPPTTTPLRAETLPVQVKTTPAPSGAKLNMVLIAGVVIGGVVLLCTLATAVYVYWVRRERGPGAKAKQLREALLVPGGAEVTPSDYSDTTPSQDTTPPSTESIKLTKAQIKALRPPLLEPSALVVQGDLIMGDGSNPPSYAPSEIDREEVEERILAGGGQVNYDRPHLDDTHVTVQADLMMIDVDDLHRPFGSSPAPSYTPSMGNDDFDDDDERAPGHVSFSLPQDEETFRPFAVAAARPNIQGAALGGQDDLMGQDLASRPRLSLDVQGQDDII